MNCLRINFKGWALVVATCILLPGSAIKAQENDRSELLYMQRLSKQFPDSAFLLLKEMVGKAIAGKDKLTMGICL